MSQEPLAVQLAKAEKRISAAALRADVRWRWAAWGRPSSGAPFLWNDIVVSPNNDDGPVRIVAAIDFVHENE